MAEASLLFPIVMIVLSSALMGYLYHRDITQAAQSCSCFISRLISHLVQRIDKVAKHTARWTYNIITGQRADNDNLEAGEYGLIQPPGLQQYVLLAPSEGGHALFPSGVEAPSITGSPDSPDSLVRALLSDDDGNSVTDDLWEILVRSGRQAQLRRSNETRHWNDHQHQHRPAVNMMADEDITHADWEIDAAGRREQGGPRAWLHGTVDRVVDRLWTKLEPEVVEVVDSV